MDAASYAIAALLRIGMRIPAGSRGEPSRMVHELREGWREFASRRWLWAIVLEFSLLVAVWDGATDVLGPVVAHDQLGGAHSWGIVLAAQSAGAVLGGLAMIKFRPRRLLLIGSLATAPTSALLFTLAVPLAVPVLAVAAFAAGVCIEVFEVNWATAMQQEIPPAALSRVSAYDAVGSWGLAPVGTVLAGPLALALGTSAVLAAGGVLIVLLTAAVLCVPEVRQLRRRQAPGPPPAASGFTRDVAVTRSRFGLLAALGVDNFGSGLFLPVVLLYVTRVVGLPLAVAGSVVALGTLAGLAVPPVAGRLVDRAGPRRVVIGAELMQALGAVTYLAARGPAAVAAAAVLLAAGQQSFYSALFALIADVAGDGPKDHPYAVAGLVRSACFGLGGLAAAGLLSLAGQHAYRLAVLVDAVSFLLCALLLARLVRDPGPAQQRRRRAVPGRPWPRARPGCSPTGRSWSSSWPPAWPCCPVTCFSAACRSTCSPNCTPHRGCRARCWPCSPR